jgi:H+/Cl- antiporter ClcA
LKILFTGITLGGGFKGGEIVPSFFVGATFGCLMGGILHISPSLAAACGMAAVFCGVTNSPISTFLISLEMFGFEAAPFFLLAIAVSYMQSGYYGLYHSQKIVYSKTRTEFINRNTKE